MNQNFTCLPPYCFILSLFCVFSYAGYTQDTTRRQSDAGPFQKSLQSGKLYDGPLQPPFNDSIASKRVQTLVQIDLDTFFKRPHFSIKKQVSSFNPFLQFNGGTVSYNWSYRSSIDTPFQERDLSQHLLTGRLQFTFSNLIPVTLTYFERQSNSVFFKDFRDVRIEFNAPEFQQLQRNQLKKIITAYTEQIRDPQLKPFLDSFNKKLFQYEAWLQEPSVMNQLLDSRLHLLSSRSIDTLPYNKDSVVQQAKAFISFYEERKKNYQQLEALRDSLQKEYIKKEKEVAYLKKLLTGGILEGKSNDLIKKALQAYGISEEKFYRIYTTLSAIKTLSIGRSVPSYSDLTLKNVNVNGINVEYNRKVYLAFSAGAIEFRSRDFLYGRQKRKPQFLYAGRLGYGLKEGTHAFFTAYKGKKQLLSNSTKAQVFEVYGMSLETQLVWQKNHRFSAEVAQSVSPHLFASTTGLDKPSFNINDHRNKAYSFRLASTIPSLKTRVDAFYQHRGSQFQSFSMYHTNAVLNSWQVKWNQYVWKRRLQLHASMAKNDFQNPDILTHYNGNTIYKNLSLTLRPKKLPSLTAGYMPSSQLTEINGTIYENYYQALNVNINHSYQLGMARGFSLLAYNRFYNDRQDSAFIYYNASHFYFNQNIHFHSYAANINVSRTENSLYRLVVLEAGINAKGKKQSLLGFGVKVNQLNTNSIKLGVYGNGYMMLKKIGELTASIEKSYLPGSNGQLFESQFYSIGFHRFFKGRL